ncbi:MAG: hypothetical protein ACPGAF_00450, partial [Pseudohongiellaceae bacterium]
TPNEARRPTRRLSAARWDRARRRRDRRGPDRAAAADLAATDPKLVPYGAMTATFYTGVGCLLGPSVLYFLVSALV